MKNDRLAQTFLEEIQDVEFEVEDMEMTFHLLDALSGDVESVSLACKNGTLKAIEKRDCPIQIEMNLSDFTTMLFSQQTFYTFAEVGLAKITDDSSIPAISKLFSYDIVPFNI